MRRAGPLSRAGSVCQDRSKSVKHKINFAITWKNFSPASRDENLPCNRDCRANTFSSLNFASVQNGSIEDRYFSFYITHEALSYHKAT